jgi:O-methyltransferase involved in polyketide biosynthesis
MKRDHNKISPTAFNHIIWRTFFGIPLADKFAEIAKNIMQDEFFSKEKSLRKTAPIIEGRNKGGEKALKIFIKKNRDCIVLELAAGFGLHGLTLSKKYREITYIETDLPAMIRLKEKIVEKMGSKPTNLYFRTADALDISALLKALSIVKRKQRLVIYCEGFLSYFNGSDKEKICAVVKSLLEKYGGVWIAPDPAQNAGARKKMHLAIPEWKRIMKSAERIVGQKYADHGFASEKEADKFFKSHGFIIKKIAWPQKLHSIDPKFFKPKEVVKIRNFLKRYGKTWVLSLR